MTNNYAHAFQQFLHRSPSSYHAATEAGELLRAGGFTHHQETDPWNAQPGGHFIIRDGALIAWFVPHDATTHSGFRIIGAHTDSPGLKLKHHPDLTNSGFSQAAVEIYGGPILPSWFDRELALAGKINYADGSTELIHTPPLLRIPHLAIHLDRNINDHLTIDKQRHLKPIWALANHHNSTDLLTYITNNHPSKVISHDLITITAQPPERFGKNNSFLAAGRLDNLSSVYPATTAMLKAAHNPGTSDILVLAFFDHEEVGSNSTTGAGGPLLETALQRTSWALGATYDQHHQMLRRSSCISADAAHSIHPNYPERHDETNYPRLGGGPVLKINANQRYASTTTSQTIWHHACTTAAITSQTFVSNNTIPCGSTIGPITATRLGIDTVDVGIPLLSMHSARELCHIDDLHTLHQALTAYLVG